MSTTAAPVKVGAPTAWRNGLVLVGLVGLAVTQPILDLMGRNPEFFVAGRYTSSQIILFSVVVAVVPSIVVVAVFGVARLAHPRAGAVVHAALVAALGALFGNVLARGLDADGGRWALTAAVLGAAVTSVIARARAGRMLLQYLAAANLLFLAGFLFTSPASALLSSEVEDGALGQVSVPDLPGPVVVLVFDELPISTLMRSDGTINAERYPAFARLESSATWYRNATSTHNRTERALPAILTGSTLHDRVLPIYEEFPRNLLSLFGTTVPVERYESVTDMCPEDVCVPREGQSIRQALEDSLVVYGHRVLPARLRESLPPIDDAWGSFGDTVDGPTGPVQDAPVDDEWGGSGALQRWQGFDSSERAPETQAARLVEQGLAVDGEPALHFAHVVVPHSPWFATPWGTRLLQPVPDWVVDPAQPGYAWSGLLRYQRHSLQTGMVDVALGQVLDHLESSGAWDDTTIVVLADHGTSTFQPDVGRGVITDANADEIFRVPLFIKEAGQTEGRVVDDVAMLTDVLPTLIDLLDIETNWTFEGHSLLDGSEPKIEPTVSTGIDALLDLARRHEADFPYGLDWTALAAVGPQAGTVGRLVGTELASLEVGSPSDLSWSPARPEAFAAITAETKEVPQLVHGTIRGADGEPPPLLLVVNGTVAGVTGGYAPVDGGWSFSSVLGPYLEAGANEIAAYAVTEVAGQPVLHQLG